METFASKNPIILITLITLNTLITLITLIILITLTTRITNPKVSTNCVLGGSDDRIYCAGSDGCVARLIRVIRVGRVVRVSYLVYKGH